LAAQRSAKEVVGKRRQSSPGTFELKFSLSQVAPPP
jgi:hypothetical protein